MPRSGERSEMVARRRAKARELAQEAQEYMNRAAELCDADGKVRAPAGVALARMARVKLARSRALEGEADALEALPPMGAVSDPRQLSIPEAPPKGGRKRR